MLKRLLPILVIPFAASAQDVRLVDDTRFDTRDRAIELLLPNDGFANVEIGDDVSFSGLATNCEIGVRPSELSGATGLPGGFNQGPIGINLSRHCDGPSNESSGVTLGGGIASLQPFRTVSLPRVDRTVVDDSTEVPSSRGTLSWGDPGPLSFQMGETMFSLHIADINETYESTVFAPRIDIDGVEAALGGFWQGAGGTIMGAQVSYATLDGTLAGDLGRVASFEDSFLTDLAQIQSITYRDICGIDGGGTADSDRIALDLYGRRDLGRAGFVELGLGARRTRSSYFQDRCIVNGLGGLNEVFAGTLSGDPVATGVNLNARFGRRLRVSNVTLIPSAGLAISSVRRDAFEEREIPAGSLISFPGDFNDGNPTLPLGTALAFEEETTTRAEFRLGLNVEIPIRTRAGDGFLLLGGAVVHQAGDGQDRYHASFVEDGRADPLRFSFLGRPVDRNWGEISVGLVVPLSERASFDLIAESLVGHEFLRRNTVRVGFSMIF